MRIGKCPYCGKFDPVMVQSTPTDPGKPYSHAVMCKACGAIGPLADTPEDAIKAYNRRMYKAPSRDLHIVVSPMPEESGDLYIVKIALLDSEGEQTKPDSALGNAITEALGVVVSGWVRRPKELAREAAGELAEQSMKGEQAAEVQP